MPATKTKQATPKNNNVFDNVKVAAPIYIGINNETSRQILEILRNKSGVVSTPSYSGISVQHNGITDAQHAIEQQLRVDLKTLRMLLFDSWNRGINLDLALRLQDLVKDELQFISREVVNQGIQASLDHYDYFASNAQA